MVLTATHTCFCHLLVIYAIEVPSGITPNQEQNALSFPYYIIRSSSAAEKNMQLGALMQYHSYPCLLVFPLVYETESVVTVKVLT